MFYLQLFIRKREKKRENLYKKIFTDFYGYFFLGKMETSKIETIATMFLSI